jgi:hypothetical protein
MNLFEWEQNNEGLDEEQQFFMLEQPPKYEYDDSMDNQEEMHEENEGEGDQDESMGNDK